MGSLDAMRCGRLWAENSMSMILSSAPIRNWSRPLRMTSMSICGTFPAVVTARPTRLGPTLVNRCPQPRWRNASRCDQRASRDRAMCDFAQSKPAFTLRAMITVPESGGKRFLAMRDGRLGRFIHSDHGRFLGLETTLHRDFEAIRHGDLLNTAISRNGDRVAAYPGGKAVILWMPDTNRRLLLSVGETLG